MVLKQSRNGLKKKVWKWSKNGLEMVLKQSRNGLKKWS